MANHPTTRLSRHTFDKVFYRDEDLVEDLIGREGFVPVMFRQILHRKPKPGELRLVEAVMVSLMEHGMTPSAISARLTYLGAPESMQGAVAAGLLGVGSQFVGSMENAAALLSEILASTLSSEEAARLIAERFQAERLPVPGFGHHLHRPDDPRSIRLLQLLGETGLSGPHHRALQALAAAIDKVAGRHITINATGAAAAVLAEIGVPVKVMRGFALVARTAGLVAHIAEEQCQPAGRFIWSLVDEAIPYASDSPDQHR